VLGVPQDREDLEAVIVQAQERPDPDVAESRLERAVHAGQPPSIVGLRAGRVHRRVGLRMVRLLEHLVDARSGFFQATEIFDRHGGGVHVEDAHPRLPVDRPQDVADVSRLCPCGVLPGHQQQPVEPPLLEMARFGDRGRRREGDPPGLLVSPPEAAVKAVVAAFIGQVERREKDDPSPEHFLAHGACQTGGRLPHHGIVRSKKPRRLERKQPAPRGEGFEEREPLPSAERFRRREHPGNFSRRYGQVIELFLRKHRLGDPPETKKPHP
jgi:hypothetical protein